MKSVEIPDLVFRKAEAAAKASGVSVEHFLAEAVRHITETSTANKTWPVPPPSVDLLESRKVERLINREFGTVHLESWE